MANVENAKAPVSEKAENQALPIELDVRINSIRPQGSLKAVASAIPSQSIQKYRNQTLNRNHQMTGQRCYFS